jgi:hypothetical protein
VNLLQQLMMSDEKRMRTESRRRKTRQGRETRGPWFAGFAYLAPAKAQIIELLLVLSSLYHVFDVRVCVCLCVCLCVSPLRSTLHLEFTYNVSVVLFLRSAALCIWNFIQNHYFDTVQNVQNVGLMKGAEPMVLYNHFTLDDIPRYYSQSQMGYRRV